jgi:hypothetical protein
MLLCDEMLLIASVLRSGDCSSYHQQVSSRRLEHIADEIRRLQEQMDCIIMGQAQDEAALAAVPLERKPRFRLVVS